MSTPTISEITVDALEADPFPVYARLRDEAPVCFVPAVGLHLVTRWDDVQFVATHPEIFTALTKAKRSCMMLYSDKLTVSLATTHIGYHQVPGKLSVERVLNVIELTAGTMRWMLGREPRIGVCGWNPHAGEQGLFGQREEERFVEPAVKRARKKKLNVDGPLVPDAVFTTNQRKK